MGLGHIRISRSRDLVGQGRFRVRSFRAGVETSGGESGLFQVVSGPGLDRAGAFGIE